jgi:glutamyl-tRNA synthetase
VPEKHRGRLAPSPTGYLHLGHARTFFVAWRRARAAGGALIFRNEDLDFQRCKPEFVRAMYDDLSWLGLDWDEGDRLPRQHGKSGQHGGIGGNFGPYSQSQRRPVYLDAWRKLRDGGFIYPCTCSRKDLERALSAPHEEEPSHGAGSTQNMPQENADDELPYPGTCRGKLNEAREWESPGGVSWRFKVPDGRVVSFTDLYFGPQTFTAGKDFSDFLVWRRD